MGTSNGMTPARIEPRLPTPDEHRRIAEAVGWGHAFDRDSLPRSLERSLFGAVAIVDGEVVGMGQLVGDGVMYWYIQDIAVLRTYQGQGIGQAIVDAMLEHIATTALAPAFVGLFATPEAVALYGRNGFAEGDL